MRKIWVPLAVALLLALAVPAAFAETELGMSWTPINDPTAGANATISLPGFHVGYSWFILYASWDALAMPAFWVEQALGDTNASTGVYTPGPYVPAFLNLFDVGVRLVFKPIELYATVGTNYLKVYQDTTNYGFGANIRLGAGLKFGWWGINVSGTSVYASWSDLTSVLKGLGSAETRDWAWAQIADGLVPAINLTFYF
jgi:hypothetical protein